MIQISKAMQLRKRSTDGERLLYGRDCANEVRKNTDSLLETIRLTAELATRRERGEKER